MIINLFSTCINIEQRKRNECYSFVSFRTVATCGENPGITNVLFIYGVKTPNGVRGCVRFFF